MTDASLTLTPRMLIRPDRDLFAVRMPHELYGRMRRDDTVPWRETAS